MAVNVVSDDGRTITSDGVVVVADYAATEAGYPYGPDIPVWQVFRYNDTDGNCTVEKEIDLPQGAVIPERTERDADVRVKHVGGATVRLTYTNSDGEEVTVDMNVRSNTYLPAGRPHKFENVGEEVAYLNIVLIRNCRDARKGRHVPRPIRAAS